MPVAPSNAKAGLSLPCHWRNGDLRRRTRIYYGQTIIGALGVSGDTSCADHNVAWRVRKALNLANVPGGITKQNNDAIVYDIGMLGKSSSGYGHPETGMDEGKIAEEIGASGSAK